MAHALSLGRVDQRGLLDLMLLFLAGWSASAPWDSLLALVLVRRRVPLVGSVVGSRVSSLQLRAAYKGWTPFQGGGVEGRDSRGILIQVLARERV